MKSKSKKYHVGSTEKERERALVYKLIDENRQWRDRYVGTLMMLAYDGCISDGRAREIIGMNIYEWRDNWRKVCKTWADGHREAQSLFKQYVGIIKKPSKRSKRAAIAPTKKLTGRGALPSSALLARPKSTKDNPCQAHTFYLTPNATPSSR